MTVTHIPLLPFKIAIGNFYYFSSCFTLLLAAIFSLLPPEIFLSLPSAFIFSSAIQTL
jgi:hypothetical protein